MQAVWYERTGRADEVLEFGEAPEACAGPGEVLVKIAFAGINPADVKRRAGSGGRTMMHRRVIPGDDGSGVIDAVGTGVSRDRIGERVWVRFANLESAFGTSAEFVTVPEGNAITLPEETPLEAGACLGVPALTASHAVQAFGDVRGKTVLVTAGAGAVGSYALQFACKSGARVIAAASTDAKRTHALHLGADAAIDYRAPDAAETILGLTDNRGVDHVIDGELGSNMNLTSAVIANHGTIVAYGSQADPTPRLPFFPLMRRGISIRLVTVFGMPARDLESATSSVTAALRKGDLDHPALTTYHLRDAAAAHAFVEDKSRSGKVVLRIP